jgi:hypothetical protein
LIVAGNARPTKDNMIINPIIIHPHVENTAINWLLQDHAVSIGWVGTARNFKILHSDDGER